MRPNTARLSCFSFRPILSPVICLHQYMSVLWPLGLANVCHLVVIFIVAIYCRLVHVTSVLRLRLHQLQLTDRLVTISLNYNPHSFSFNSFHALWSSNIFFSIAVCNYYYINKIIIIVVILTFTDFK